MNWIIALFILGIICLILGIICVVNDNIGSMLFFILAIFSIFRSCYYYTKDTETLTTVKIKEPYITEDGYGIYYKQSDTVLSKMGNSGIALDPNSDSEWIYKELDADEVEICNDLTEFDSSYMRAWSYAYHDEEDIHYEIHIPENLELTELPQ